MDKSAENPAKAHRAGYLFGSIFRRYLRFERATNLRFLGKGMNPVLCQWISLISRLGLIALVLYLGFWVALAVLAVWVIQGTAEVGVFSNAPAGEEDEGWEHGLSGFGYYMDGHRVDPGRCDDE